MKTLTSNMQNALNERSTYLCRVWTLTLVNGEIYRFTDLDRDVTFAAHLYRADPGIRVSSVSTAEIGQLNNATVSVRSSENFLSLARVRQGALDLASFELNTIDWRNPDFYGPIPVFSGAVKDVKFHNKGKYDVELEGGLALKTTEVGGNYSQTCRAQLGDAKCKFDLEGLAVSFTVDTTAVDAAIYQFSATEAVGLADDYLKFGRVVWLTGNNSSYADEIKGNVNASGLVSLSLPPRNPILTGDTGKLYPGCDKRVSTCALKFANLANFRGEPYGPSSLTLDPIFLTSDNVSGDGVSLGGA